MLTELKSFIDKLDVTLLGTIPADDHLAEFEFSGKPLVELSDESSIYQAVEKMMVQTLR